MTLNTTAMLQAIREQNQEKDLEIIFQGVVQEYQKQNHAHDELFNPEDVHFPIWEYWEDDDSEDNSSDGKHFMKTMSEHGIYDESFAKYLAQAMLNLGWTVQLEGRRIYFKWPENNQ